jgi:hypothetical protein
MPQITASWQIGVIGVIDGGQRLIACVSGRLGGARDGARATSGRGCLERNDRQRRFASRHRYHWKDTGMTHCSCMRDPGWQADVRNVYT